MSAVSERKIHPLGTHRVIDPAGAMPQAAWKLDNTPVPHANEILCDVETLNIDSASFKQIADACHGDAGRIADHIIGIVNERGKQHNPVTGSGGMFIGSVAEVGESLRGTVGLEPGDRIASLVSLSLTPLHIDEIERIDVTTGRVWIRGKAILFQSGIWAKLPSDIDENVALAVLDVAGAPAQVRRLCKTGQTVVVIGAGGKSGMLSCAEARRQVGPDGHVIGVVPHPESESAQLILSDHLVDTLVRADARNALELSERVAEVVPDLADVTINCVNVPGTEMSSILSTKDDGIVYFFSMSTSFTAAALGAEGVGRDVTMIIGNGYAKDHAQTALQTLRDHPHLHDYFNAKYAKKH